MRRLALCAGWLLACTFDASLGDHDASAVSLAAATDAATDAGGPPTQPEPEASDVEPRPSETARDATPSEQTPREEQTPSEEQPSEEQSTDEQMTDEQAPSDEQPSCACQHECRSADNPDACHERCDASGELYDRWSLCLRESCADACEL
jgi:hypothetical protein